MRAVSRELCFYRKGTGNFLPAQYAAAAALSEMPLEKSGERWKRKQCRALSNRLRPLRQTRPRAVSAESRAFGFVQRLFSSEQIAG